MDEDLQTWSGVLCPEGVETGDGRMFALDSITWRDLPLPLLWQESSSMGHDGSVVVGRIDKIWRENGLIHGEGVLLDNDEAKEATELLRSRALRGVSVDLDAVSAHFEEDEDQDEESLFPSGVLVVDEGRISAATLVSIPAFAEAYIALGEDAEKPEEDEDRDESLAASAYSLTAGAIPRPVDARFFQNPNLAGPTPHTVLEDGHVFGHLAQWDECHIGMADACTVAPKSATGYAGFLLGAKNTTEGVIPTGKLTMSTGHAGEWDEEGNPLSPAAVVAHYDNTGTAMADVVVGEDRYGIWYSGKMRSGLTEEQKEEFFSATISGDWRSQRGGNLELVAALCVNVPGFGIPRVRLAASCGVQTALVAAGIVKRDEEYESAVDTVATEVMNRLALIESNKRAEAERLFAEEGMAELRAARLKERV